MEVNAMKKLFLVLLAFLSLLAGCASNKESSQIPENQQDEAITVNTQDQDEPQEPDPENVMEITEELDMWINLQDPMELLELADEVIIGRVKSVDGCSNYNEWKQTYDSDGIYTFGTIEVLQSVKGDLKEGQVIDYLKMGGIIGKEEYLKGVSDSVKNKKDFDPAKMKPFISSYYADDVRIENGKEYLIYLGNDFEKYMANRYAIFYLGGGLREVNLEEGSILNNFTGTWEDLDSLLSRMSVK